MPCFCSGCFSRPHPTACALTCGCSHLSPLGSDLWTCRLLLCVVLLLWGPAAHFWFQRVFGYDLPPRQLGIMTKPTANCQVKLRSLQSMTQHIYWLWLRLRTKKGLQGGKTIQQRSEFFASLVPNASTSSLAHALCALCTHVCVSTTLSLLSLAWLPHYCSFSGAGTHDSDGPLCLNVVTY